VGRATAGQKHGKPNPGTSGLGPGRGRGPERRLGKAGRSVYQAPFARALGLNIPNLITLARILSVPIMVWAISSGEMLFAFALFVLAGLSDAVDGYLAKRLDMASELGAYLDPIADKALIVSIYVTLGISGAVPRPLVILVVSRDIMIVGAVMLAWLLGKPIAAKPLMVSKINTAAQIAFAGLVLASRFRRRHRARRGHGRGCRLDAAFDRRLCPRMGAAHGLQRQHREDEMTLPGNALRGRRR